MRNLSGFMYFLCLQGLQVYRCLEAGDALTDFITSSRDWIENDRDASATEGSKRLVSLIG